MTRRSSKTWIWIGALGLVALGAGIAATARLHVQAADHLDPPARTSPDIAMGGSATPDRAADIADVYAWHRGTGATASVVTIMSFSGPNPAAAGQEMPCDRDVLYTIHISNDADLEPEFNIQTRFAEDDVGNCFMRIEGIPGTTAPMIGRVEHVMQSGSNMAFAGLRDDAFFFDLVGFRETRAMGTLRFMSTRDFFAGQNTPAIAVEFPLSAVSTAGGDFRVWATTGRRTGA